MDQDHRTEARYYKNVHHNLSVTVKRTHNILGAFRKPLTATWMDFNRYGMGFETTNQHRIGEQVLLDLSLDDKNISDIVALVCNARRSRSGQYRHGVKFDYRANDHMRSKDVEYAIESIEVKLKHILSNSALSH